jgi:hypothetical protein
VQNLSFSLLIPQRHNECINFEFSHGNVQLESKFISHDLHLVDMRCHLAPASNDDRLQVVLFFTVLDSGHNVKFADD